MRNYQYYDGSSHVLLHAPHGGKHITDLARGSLTISQEEISAEILAMTDSHTDRMSNDISDYAFAYGQTGKRAPVFRNNLSRLVVDPERFPDEREEMNAVGMGAVYTHGSKRQQIRVENSFISQRLIDLYFKPYANSMEYQVDSLLKRFDRTTIVDLHSYASVALPYELHSEDHRPEICIGVDDFHSDPEQINGITEILHREGFETAINAPFSGTYVPLKHYGKDSRVTSVMFEIRRDTYMNELTGEEIKDKYKKLVLALAKAIDFLSL